MYKVPAYKVPEGFKLSEYAIILCKDIKEGNNVEDAKDKLFRMTYPIMLQELKKYTNLAPLDIIVSDLSIAFMKTIKSFDPYREGASFMNYYKRTLNTEVIYNYYGKYKNSEELKKLKKKFEGTIQYLDDSVHDKNDVETGSWYDMLEDTNTNIENDILKDDYRQTVHKIIDRTFSRRHKGLQSDTPKKIFTDYIDTIMDDSGVKNLEIAEKYGVVKSSISNTIRKYEPIFKEEYKKGGM